jgi:Ca2+-binding RTX toxin-like protein
MMLESLSLRVLFSAEGWTTVEIADPTAYGDGAGVTIPVAVELHPLTSDSRLSERVLQLGGTTANDTFHLSLTQRFAPIQGIKNYIAFGYAGEVAATALDDPKLNASFGDPNQWQHDINEWFQLTSRNGNVSVLTGTYGNNAFFTDYGAIERITADTGAGADTISIDPQIKTKTQLVGGRGDDVLVGGGGYALLSGGDGSDKLYARGSSSDLYGGANSDLLVGGTGIDRLYGGGGNDRLNGGPTVTTLARITGQSNIAAGDLLSGGKGNDRALRDIADTLVSIEGFL